MAADAASVGTGLTMEGIEQNPVVYELALDLRWQTSPPDIQQWITSYHTRRYGVFSPGADRAWQRLANTVYNCTRDFWSVTKSMVVLRPKLDLLHAGFMPTSLFYDPSDLVLAWLDLIHAATTLPMSPSLRYDLVDVTRQVLSNTFSLLHGDIVESYDNGALTSLQHATEAAVEVIRDLDHILSYSEHFMLGPRVARARAMGADEEDADYMEWNLRNQLTLWGPHGTIVDYASKQWADLIRSYHLPRWRLFFERLVTCVKEGVEFDQSEFDAVVFQLEEDWQHPKQEDSFTLHQTDDILAQLQLVVGKYVPALQVAHSVVYSTTD
mmetsp:Transcript_61107/g.144303  ORF Transcript_61107/g.144303 Transcript_61107/m.144303 type:complete len:325 (-) Transcript_61107:29-1003(-)